MPGGKRVVRAFRIGLPGVASRHYPREAYRRLAEAVLSDSEGSPLAVRASDIELARAALTKALQRTLAKGDELPRCLVLELVCPEADVRVFDKVCLQVNEAIDEPTFGTTRPFDILFLISSRQTLQESLAFAKCLVPACQRAGIGLMSIVPGSDNTIDVLHDAGNFVPQNEIELPPALSAADVPRKPRAFSPQEIQQSLRTLWGHFEVRVSGRVCHVPLIASLGRLLADAQFALFIATEIQALLETESFSVIPVGIPGSGIDELSLGVVGNDSRRILALGDGEVWPVVPTAVLCDLLCDSYGIDEIVGTLKRRGADHIAVLGIAKYASFREPEGVRTRAYTTFQCRDHPNGEPCAFCEQGSTVAEGDYVEHYAKKLSAFEPCVFWELVNSVPGGYEAAHWPSDRTGYHYKFRVLTLPIFKTHGYGIAWRVRNLLHEKGIVADWIKKIVCPQEPEAIALAESIAEVLGLGNEDIVPVHRRYFGRITADSIPPELSATLSGASGLATIQRKNVIIVDQAAHRLGTYHPLSLLCQHCGCDVLAFVVFLDRVSPSASLGDFLPHSHYVWLYSWPAPPSLWYSCPCSAGVK